MTSQAVGPGRRLAGRYRLEDLLGDTFGARAWRAVDEVLQRPVFVQTLDGADPRSAHLSHAARAASVVSDTRFLRVLDVAEEDGTTYVVREWVPGHNLVRLLESGPLPPEHAAAVAREVADALAAAHRQGLHHLCLQPGSVVVAPDGTVKVTGLATDAVVAGVSSTDPARDDAAGVGRILYAGLTARWPGPEPTGLATAPLVDERFAAPRQVRPGVPRSLDDTVVRALGGSGRHNAAALDSPAAVLAAITSAGEAARRSTLREVADDAGPAVGAPARGAPADQHPALLPEERPVGGHAAVPVVPVDPEPAGSRDRRAIRALAVVASLLLLVGATLVGLQLLVGGLGGEDDPAPAGGQGGDPTGEEGEQQPTPTEPAPLPISAVVDYDPEGNDEENPDRAGDAIDGDPDTWWPTQTYFDPLELQKDGVGIALDLGEPREVAAVRLQLVGETSGVQIRVAPADAEVLPEQAGDWETVATEEEAGEELELVLEERVSTGWVLVWFTRLPPADGDFRGGIAEVEVLG